MDNEKEKWQEDILNSLNGLQRAEPDPRLYEKVRNKTFGGQFRAIQRPYVALAAACLAILVMANVWAVSQKNPEQPAHTVYELDRADFDLYQHLK